MELNSLNELGEEKSFELSAFELVRYAVIDTFFNKLEMIIQKLTGKHKTLILCGDWNINFHQTSPHTRELNNLL